MLAQSQEGVLEAQLAHSLSRPVSSWAVFKATVMKDIQIEMRYLPDLIGRFIELSIRVLFFIFLSGIISFKTAGEAFGGSLTGENLFIFLQGGVLLLIFSGTALNAPVTAVSRDISNGTMEFLYSNPSSRYAYFVGIVVAHALISQIVFFPFYLFLVFYSGANLINTLMIFLVCLTVLITIVALGIMIALLGMLWRQVGSVTQVLGLLFEFLAGAYFPVSAFPSVLQYLAYLLPYTWGYDLIRYYSFAGRWNTLLPIEVEWALLVLYAILFTLLSRFLLRKAEQQAKKKGLHLL